MATPKELIFLRKLRYEHSLDSDAYHKLLDERLKAVVEEMKAKRAKEREDCLRKSGYVF